VKNTCCNFDCRQGRDCPNAPATTADNVLLFFALAVRLGLCAVPFIIWKMGT